MRALWIPLFLSGAAAQGGPPVALNTCSGRPAQKWTYQPNQTLTVPGGFCLDIESFNTDVNATVWTWPCGDGSQSNEFWNVTANAIQSEENPGLKCLSVAPGVTAAIGAQVTTAVCNPVDPAQTLAYSAATGLIVHTPSGLCLDSSVADMWCSHSPQNTWLVCDPLAAIDARSADIVSRLSLGDKIQALGTGTPSLPSVGLPSYNWWSEATHGISHVSYTPTTPYASNTGLPITTGASFNRSLWYATANQIAREARAFMNQGNAFSTYWAPVINLVRDPRWGRNLETSGEDPFHVGTYATEWSKGFQTAPEDPNLLQASACCKHFVANELDGWNGTDRDHFNAIIDPQDLSDTYLVPFQACVEQGQVSGIMCSYNAVNGVPSCANDWLLGTVLRQGWNFDGYVTSDCDADSDVYNTHHYTATPEEAVADVLHAGTDVDCGGFVTQNANSTLQQGLITVDDIDTVLKRLFRVRLRLGYFDPAGGLQTIGPDQICNAYAVELARDGVRQGSVLLKNAGATLPIDSTKISSAAVIGPNTNYSQDIAQYYGGNPCFNNYTNMFDAIQQFIPNTQVAQGLPAVNSFDTSLFPAAIALALQVDLVVLSIGNSLQVEHEGMDRVSIDLPGAQRWLVGNITAALAAAGKSTPVVAVTYGGGMVDVSSLLADAGVGALLHTGYPSVQVLGVGDVIFGRTPGGSPVAPAARMGQTTYYANFTDSVSLFDFGMRPGASPWPPGTNPGRTYRFYTGTPVLPFGFGLSYTTWTYTPFNPPAVLNLRSVAATLEASQALTRSSGTAAAEPSSLGLAPKALSDVVVDYFVNVTNTGSVDSDDVVLGFLVPPGAGSGGVPLQELFGFERVHVPAGQTVTVYLGAQGSAFTQVTPDGVRRVWPGEYTVRFGVAEAAAHGMGFAEVRSVVAA